MICDHPPAIYQLANDHGGQTNIYLARAAMMRVCGDALQISGACYSSCTFYLALPRLCARPGAVFGFHEAYYADGRRLDPAALATSNAQMLDSYPAPIRAWLAARGGLAPALKYLPAAQAIRMGAVKAC